MNQTIMQYEQKNRDLDLEIAKLLGQNVELWYETPKGFYPHEFSHEPRRPFGPRTIRLNPVWLIVDETGTTQKVPNYSSNIVASMRLLLQFQDWKLEKSQTGYRCLINGQVGASAPTPSRTIALAFKAWATSQQTTVTAGDQS